MICSRCGGPTVELFLTRACKAECDLTKSAPVPRKMNNAQALEAILAHKAVYRNYLGGMSNYWDGEHEWVRFGKGQWTKQSKVDAKVFRAWLLTTLSAYEWELTDAPV